MPRSQLIGGQLSIVVPRPIEKDFGLKAEDLRPSAFSSAQICDEWQIQHAEGVQLPLHVFFLWASVMGITRLVAETVIDSASEQVAFLVMFRVQPQALSRCVKWIWPVKNRHKTDNKQVAFAPGQCSKHLICLAHQGNCKATQPSLAGKQQIQGKGLRLPCD